MRIVGVCFAYVFLVILGLCSLAKAQHVSNLSRPYTPIRSASTALSVLQEITERTGIEFSYSEEALLQVRVFRFSGAERTVGAVLNTMLAGTDLEALERGGKVLIIPKRPAPSVTVSGIVTDSASHEVVIGCFVSCRELGLGTVTNQYGFYSITIPVGKRLLTFNSIGYRSDSVMAPLSGASLRLDRALSSGITLSAVRVSSSKESLQDATVLNLEDITRHAGLLGENDVLKSLQHVSGVQSATDGLSSLLVRGGDPGHNMNILDGVPLYYTEHFFGLTSIFNTDAVKSVSFYKGAFPARYGGRLASVTDVSTRDGNMERFAGTVSVGLLKGSATLEGPLIRNKSSFLLAARRTWIDALWRPFFDDFRLNFYDVNGKVNTIINKNNRVYASFYSGRDQFAIRFLKTDLQATWGNAFGALRWATILSPRLFVNTSFSYSRFRYLIRDVYYEQTVDTVERSVRYKGRSTISEAALRVQADYYPSARLHVQGGAVMASSNFSPASTTFAVQMGGRPAGTVAAEPFTVLEWSVYAEAIWDINRLWRLRAGMHNSMWFNKSFRYVSPQPRVQCEYRFSNDERLFLSVTRMSQFLHLLQDNSGGFPSEVWVPGAERIRPSDSWVGSLGYQRRLKGDIELKGEVYHKTISGILAYRGTGNIFSNSLKWQDNLTQGQGKSYGLEVQGAYTKQKLTLQACYTLAWALRRFAELNQGRYFPYRYDRRHNFKINMTYHPRKRFMAIVGWTFMSGEAISIPSQAYSNFQANNLGSLSNYPLVYYYNQPNNYRLPSIHRLDVSVNFIRRKGAHYVRTWTFGLFNAYGQQNLVGVTLLEVSPGQISINGLSLFRYVPVISYQVNF